MQHHITSRRLLNVIFIIAFFLLMLSSFFAYQQLRQRVNAINWLVHTHQVIETIDDVFLAVIDAERQETNYVHTHDKKYLLKYQLAIQKAQNAFIQARNLTTDNPQQQQRLNQLEPLISETSFDFNELFKNNTLTPKQNEMLLFLSNKQENLINQIKIILDQMDHEEHMLLRERNQGVLHTSQITSILIVGLAGLSGLFLIITFFALSYQERRFYQQKLGYQKLEQENKLAHDTSRLKDEFLANMSHELRTPLNAIIGFSQLIYDGETGPITAEQKEFMHDILSNSKHLLTLISEILDLSKIEAGKIDFYPEAVYLPRLLNEVISSFQPFFKEKNISFKMTVDENVSIAYIDPTRFKQIAYNYLSNAIKFTPNGGQIEIRIKDESLSTFKLEVEDTGVGIKADDIHKLFIEFQQLDTSMRKKYPGTGLGLALTKHIVEAQGGKVGVISEPGKGSVFYAILPKRHIVHVEQSK